jgi:hypothetical protein
MLVASDARRRILLESEDRSILVKLLSPTEHLAEFPYLNSPVDHPSIYSDSLLEKTALTFPTVRWLISLGFYATVD